MSGQPGPQDLSELNADGRRMVRDAATIGGLRTALADCIALLDTFAEVAQERGETVDWAMLSVMADKHRPLIVSDDYIAATCNLD